MYDVIIVGARCAGSPLAMLLARGGHRVLVVDRASFPSDTISTHYINQTGLLRLADWGLLDRVVATGVPAIRQLNFSYLDIYLGGFADPIDGIDAVYAPRRTVLDKILVDASREAGAEVIEGFTVQDVIFSDGRAVGIRGRFGDGPEREFRGSFVVGADGRNSTVAEQVGADFYRVVPAACFVYYSYYTGLDWPFHHRTGAGEQQIGTWPTNDGHLLSILCRRDRYRAFRADVENNFHAVYDAVMPDLGADLRASGKRTENFRPMLYPDNYYRRSAGPGWALLGDAGYHKDPFTGWGIADAFQYAELLADHLHRGLSGQCPIDDAAVEYTKIRDERSRSTFEFTCAISELTPLNPYLDTVFHAVAQSPGYTKKFFMMIAGALHGEEFFAPDNLDMLFDEVGVPREKRLRVAS